MINELEKATKKQKHASWGKLRGIIITAAICLLLLSSVITFVSKLVKYNELQDQKTELIKEICERKDSIEELKYWIDAPMDDDYIMKFAREKLDLFRADEIVFTNGQEE